MSLRLRLILIVVVAVSLSVGTMLWLSWERLGQEMSTQRRQDLAMLLQAEEDLLDDAMDSYHARKVQAVAERRVRLKRIGTMAKALLASVGGAQPGHVKTAGRLSGLQVQDDKLVLYKTEDTEDAGATEKTEEPEHSDTLVNDTLVLVHMSQKALQTELADGGVLAAGPLSVHLADAAQILRTLPEKGSFFVCRELHSSGQQGRTARQDAEVLVFALPVWSPQQSQQALSEADDIVLVMQPMRDLILAERSFRTQLLLALYSRYLEDPVTHMVIFEGERLLVSTSHMPVRLPEGFVQRLREQNSAAFVEEDDTGVLAAGRYFESTGWAVCMQIDMNTVTAPVRQAFVQLGLVTLLFLLAALVLSVAAMHKSLRPLLQLTRRTRKLADLDMSSAHALEALEHTTRAHLPLQRKDELGDLARAYAAMGRALGQNIRTLVRETADRERLAGEIAAAALIQKDMLPDAATVSSLSQGQAAAYLSPARDVGGDLFDVLQTGDGRTAYVVGDVSGKGVPAALFMAQVMTLVRWCVQEESDPGRAMTRVNALLERNNKATMFVTLFICVHDAATGQLAYANGGHCAPFVLRSGMHSDTPRLERLASLSGPVVGVMPGLVYTSMTAALAPKDRVLIFTDGISEARDRQGAFYGEERLAAVLVQQRTLSPAALLAYIAGDVTTFMDSGAKEPGSQADQVEQTDDFTMLCLEQAAHATPHLPDARPLHGKKTGKTASRPCSAPKSTGGAA